MFNISVSPKWILERLGLDADPELVELLAQLSSRMSFAQDKRAFVKDCLRKALGLQ